VNTVETKAYLDTDKNWRGFNALMGVPGVLFDQKQQFIEPARNITPPVLISASDLGNAPFPPLRLLPRARTDVMYTVTDLLDRARLIEVGRPGARERKNAGAEYLDHQDGRYYSTLSELLGFDSEFVEDVPGQPSDALHPLSTEEEPGINNKDYYRSQWADEVVERFGAMSNMVTMRSDVFELLVTVQAGYAVDANNDGRINYRSNDEFVVTAEKKARSVYER
jgi:hypothetical protein